MQRHTFHQILSSVTAFLTIFQTGMWRGYLSVVIFKFQAGEVHISMTLDDLSWMVALTDIGGLFSPFPTGYLMDRFGRLFVLRLAFIFYLSGTALVFGATSWHYMYSASVLAGFGKGIAHSTSSLYVAEIAKPNLRGSLSSINILMLLLGASTPLTFGPHISFKFLTWTTLACPVVGLFLTFVIVESPYYHLIKNNETAAARTLSRVRNKIKANEKDVELELIRKRVDSDMKGSKKILELVSRKGNRRALTIVLMLTTLKQAVGINCIQAYALTTLPADSFWKQNITMMLFSWLTIASSLLGMSFVDRVGSKTLQVISASGLSFAMGLSAIFYFFQHKSGVDVSQFIFTPHIGLLICGILYPMGVGQAANTYRGELLPVSIKGQASAIASMVQSAISFVLNKMYFVVDQSIGVYVMYAIFSTSCFINVVFTGICVFETKGKTLAEIQDTLNK